MSSQGMIDGFIRGMVSNKKNNTSYLKTSVTKKTDKGVNLSSVRSYELFLSLIDSETGKRLHELDNTIYLISNSICQKTGWFLNGEIFMFKESDLYTESKSRHSYYVIRGDYGYEPLSIEEECVSFEKEFIEKNAKDLNVLYDAYSMKETIMCGGYSVKDPNATALAQELCRYLGYSREKQVQKEYK